MGLAGKANPMGKQRVLGRRAYSSGNEVFCFHQYTHIAAFLQIQN
jgi:hypothetical protein